LIDFTGKETLRAIGAELVIENGVDIGDNT
jgi:hypothetical protein